MVNSMLGWRNIEFGLILQWYYSINITGQSLIVFIYVRRFKECTPTVFDKDIFVYLSSLQALFLLYLRFFIFFYFIMYIPTKKCGKKIVKFNTLVWISVFFLWKINYTVSTNVCSSPTHYISCIKLQK